MPTSFLYHGFGPVGYDYVPPDAQGGPLYFLLTMGDLYFYGESLQAQEKNLPATQKRAIPMITVPANERVFQAKINVGMETSRAG